MQVVQLIERVRIDRDGYQLAVDTGLHAMFVRTPSGEEGKVIKYLFGVGMEDMRPILMHQDSSVVIKVVGVPRNVRPAIDHENLCAHLRSQPLCEYASCEACANN